ncbi:MAG: hypothetical protein C0407_03095 [Desulfobacca sp.]|nr:hypothetical protein [Desulfobacca sp.]
MINKSLGLVLALVLFLALSACGKSRDEKSPEKSLEKKIEESSGGQVKVDLSQEQIKIKDQHGEATFSSKGLAQIPADFPKDLYIHPSAKTLITQRVDGGFHLLLESTEAPEPLINTYKEKMKAHGWKETNAITMGATGIFTYEKSNRRAIVTISQSEKGKTGIQLQVSLNK